LTEGGAMAVGAGRNETGGTVAAVSRSVFFVED